MIDQSPLTTPPKILTYINPLVIYRLDYYSKLLNITHLIMWNRALKIIAVKSITMLHGEQFIKWSETKVATMNNIKNLQHAIVDKFSYDWPDLKELRSMIPAQCNIKGDCQIYYFRNRHILIRLSSKKDFINLTSKDAFYIKSKYGASY